jgi:hypothetical protein
MDVYSAMAVEFKRLHPFCCYCKKRRTTDIHHERGRIGPLLLDIKHWKPCCRRCHDTQPGHANSKGPRT